MNRTGEKHEAVDWVRFEDCPICGGRAGSHCWSSNGSKKKIPCAGRPYTPDAIRDKFAELEAKLLMQEQIISGLKDVIGKQQRQIDLLIGELE